MKRFYFVLGLLLAFVVAAQAQTTPPEGTPVMTMTVQPNVDIEFDLARANETGIIWIDPGDSTFTAYSVTNSWNGYINVHTQGNYVKIYGSLRNFELLNQNVSHIDVSQMLDLRYLDVEGNGLSELDLSQNYNMEKLYFNYNNISHMDLSHCNKLTRLYARQNNLVQLLVNPTSTAMEIIYCDGNMLGACALDSLFTSMPVSNLSPAPQIVLDVNGEGDNPGNLTSHTSIAINKGWEVLRWIQSTVFQDIFGDGTGCDINIGAVEEHVANTFSVFPNPAQNSIILNFDSKDSYGLKIFNLVGQEVMHVASVSEGQTIAITNLHSGLYMVALIDKNGIIIETLKLRVNK